MTDARPPIPRPDWRPRQPHQALWRKILAGFIEVFAIFGAGETAGSARNPQIVPPMTARMRVNIAASETETAKQASETKTMEEKAGREVPGSHA